MTDTLPPVETAPDPQLPLEPAPERKPRRWAWALGATIAVVAIAGAAVALGHVSPPPADHSTPGVCGAWLTVRPTTFNGIALDVKHPGPDMVTVDIWGSFDEHRRLFQQVTKNSPGANFMAWDFGYKIEQVEVSFKNGAHCSVDTTILDQVNTANGHN